MENKNAKEKAGDVINVGVDQWKQEFKELHHYLDALALNPMDAGHTWIAFIDKFNSFQHRILAAVAATPAPPVSGEKVYRWVKTKGNERKVGVHKQSFRINGEEYIGRMYHNSESHIYKIFLLDVNEINIFPGDKDYDNIEYLEEVSLPAPSTNEFINFLLANALRSLTHEQRVTLTESLAERCGLKAVSLPDKEDKLMAEEIGKGEVLKAIFIFDERCRGYGIEHFVPSHVIYLAMEDYLKSSILPAIKQEAARERADEV